MSQPTRPPFIGQIRYVKQNTFNTHYRVAMQQYTPDGWETIDVHNPEWETEEDAAKHKRALDDGRLKSILDLIEKSTRENNNPAYKNTYQKLIEEVSKHLPSKDGEFKSAIEV